MLKMEDRTEKKLLSILGIVPPLKKILASKEPLEKKRKKIRDLLNTMLIDTYDDNPDLPSLTWMLRRDSILVFRHIISRRSEEVSGVSFLG